MISISSIEPEPSGVRPIKGSSIAIVDKEGNEVIEIPFYAKRPKYKTESNESYMNL